MSLLLWRFGTTNRTNRYWYDWIFIVQHQSDLIAESGEVSVGEILLPIIFVHVCLSVSLWTCELSGLMTSLIHDKITCEWFPGYFGSYSIDFLYLFWERRWWKQFISVIQYQIRKKHFAAICVNVCKEEMVLDRKWFPSYCVKQVRVPRSHRSSYVYQRKHYHFFTNEKNPEAANKTASTDVYALFSDSHRGNYQLHVAAAWAWCITAIQKSHYSVCSLCQHEKQITWQTVYVPCQCGPTASLWLRTGDRDVPCPFSLVKKVNRHC